MPKRREPEELAQPDLAPFMNMVVILIPMLLLSVIFVSAGVVNVSANLTTPASSVAETDKKPLELTVALSHQGFEVLANDERFAPVEDCPADGPTVCLSDASFDVAKSFERAKNLHDQGRADAAEEALQAAMQAYDFRGLYNQLSAIKKDHPDETKVILTGEPNIPYAMLIRAMDVARFQLDKQSYRESSQFWAANEKVIVGKARPLFSDPVLAVVQ